MKNYTKSQAVVKIQDQQIHKMKDELEKMQQMMSEQTEKFFTKQIELTNDICANELQLREKDFEMKLLR